MKKFLIILGLFLLLGYLIFSAFYFKDKPKDGNCTYFEVVVKNNDEGEKFVNTAEVVKHVTSKGLNPVGKRLKDINTSEIESAILQDQLIKEAQAYITDNGAIRVNIIERKPVLRVMPSQGASYYVDNEGKVMALSKYFTAHLPIASGTIKESFAKDELYKFALFLSKDSFWDAQVEQIIVDTKNELTLIPRVGEHRIILGQIDGFEEKLEKLLLFYKEGLNETGWNKYSTINLKFDKQVVCIRR